MQRPHQGNGVDPCHHRIRALKLAESGKGTCFIYSNLASYWSTDGLAWVTRRCRKKPLAEVLPQVSICDIGRGWSKLTDEPNT
ncbi:hypothetical protein OAL01_02450 [Rubripirellula sp.]|nr:hypothetical protein [Rubripirellula sp.]